MRRKIAFIAAAVMTVVFMFLRWFSDALAEVTIGSLKMSNLILGLCLVTVAAIVALCFSKKATVHAFTDGSRGTVSGWLCTFCGAILAMSALLDLVCWIVYKQVPPPNAYILNNIDLFALIATLLFGGIGGVFLVMQGFKWMSHTEDDKNQPLLNWLSLAPVLWMWFRLARYEISYASTIDISESFFDFAILIFASLFFLQLARAVSGIGPAPKNGLLMCALCTGFIALSGAPVTIAELAHGEPIGSLLGAVVDMIIGIFAFGIALMQAFPAAQNEEDAVEVSDDTLAWTEPERDLPPMEPAFEIDRVLPKVEVEAVAFAEEAPVKDTVPAAESIPVIDNTPVQEDHPTPAPSKEALTIDDILTEIESIE